MLSHVWSSTNFGIDALPIEVETNIESGVPKYTVVGLPYGAVRESLDRIWAALKNSGLPVPYGRITINLAPAEVRKESAAFDLPLAIGLLAANGDLIKKERLRDVYILGELSLDGKIRSIKGVLPMAIRAKEEGKRGILVPSENACEASVVEGLAVYPIETVRDAFALLSGHGKAPKPFIRDVDLFFDGCNDYKIDFSEVRGQENVKRALTIAASGGHNVLLVGPPGSGKTMLAKRLPTILPPLTAEEALETTKIHSVGGKLDLKNGLVSTRPFRSPHHTISDAGLCGGGANPQPGEISLSHNGVLFLDELPEFKRQVLEVMRQPMEEGMITISRAKFSVDYPARFMLVASMNPCPCGYYNDPNRTCVCAPTQVQRYLSKISGPLMDRIDMHIEVSPVPFEELNQGGKEESSASIRKRVTTARQNQDLRFEKEKRVFCNAQMTSRLVRKHCVLDSECQNLMQKAIKGLGLSARAFDRILKVSRTISDIEGDKKISAMHLAEAIQYRSLDRNWWHG